MKKKTRILLTAYGPFGEVKENITERIVRDIERAWAKTDCELETLVMPVEWTAAEELLEQRLHESHPDIVLGLGHADSYPAPTIETRYFNNSERADNKGKFREGGIIKRGGKMFYETNVDVELLLAQLTKEHIPAVVHGGTEGMNYLCNFAGYIIARTLHEMNDQKTEFIFIHVPSPKMLP